MIADCLRDFIETHGYDYSSAGHNCYRLRFSGKNGDYNTFAQVSEDGDLVMLFTYCPVKIPEDRRAVAADYINRVNYGLLVGCLEMDASDGEVRSRSVAPVDSDEVGPTVFGPLFDSSFYLIENWLPGLLRVAFGSDDPADAYAATLDGLMGHTCEPMVSEREAEVQTEHELTAIEQQVLELLAEHDGQVDTPPPSV
jgi:hypothetical protein